MRPSPTQRILAFEHDSKILEKISKRYKKRSKESQALERAAIAFWYVLTQDYERFAEYYRQWKKGELSAEQKNHLKSLGIEV
jgi:hypothetical protein